MPTARETLINLYLDYFNNYLTISKFAEHNHLQKNHAHMLIDLASQVYHSPNPEE